MNIKAALAIAMVFVGCCSNVVFLELVVKEDPGAGNLATFLQFLFIASVGFCTVGKFGTATRQIPFKQYLLLVAFFWTSSVANNYAFDFNISMPLHMIFRAGSLMANMAMGVWILKKRYPALKYLAIFMISAGIAICTIQSSGDVKAPRETHQDAAEEEKLKFIDWLWWCLGIAILTFALFVSARMGIFQESLYSKHGKHPWEALYYTHLLPLVFWLPTAPNLINHVKLALDTPLVDFMGVTLPKQVLWLILYVSTQGLCISAVYVLTTECASLVVTLTVTLRKFVSLIFSILYFRNPFTTGHWIGTLLVFIGTMIFTEILQKCIYMFVPTDKKKKKQYGEPIKLPENLESLPRAEHFAAQRHRWNTNEEIAAILISFDKHSDWQSKEVKIRPKSGSMLLYSRKKVRYRRDGYCWKKRKDGKTTREDHMKLKVQGTECIYGCYVHSAILPTFHRRCYWLLQNPDIVLVHYLNVPYPDDNKLAAVAPSLALWADKKEWTKEELVSQLKPMFFSEDEHDLNSDLEISTTETVEAIVGQLMEKQRAARAAALARQLECGCPDSTCQDSRTCAHPLRRIQNNKPPPSDHHVSSTTGPSPRPMAQPPRQYTRDHRPSTQSSPLLLSLGQIQGGGGLLILNGTSNGAQQHSSLVSPLSVTSFVCEEPRDRYRQQYKPTFVLKREIPDSQQNTCLNTTETTFKVESCVDEKVEIEPFDRKIKIEPRSRNQLIASAPVTPLRYPDLVERLESKVHTENCDDTLVLLGTDAHLETSSGFFDETLELSHEDIQKTLSANMPTCELDRSVVRSTETANVMVSGIDTMDFIESCEAVASPTQVVDDNVFVNLDAFDMLGDFPELEVLDPSTLSTNPVSLCGNSPQAEENNEKMQTDSPGEGTLSITDYSPEWAYPEGGVKVLIAGPWTDTSEQYTILFDNFPVPSILVQNGLLRCYCPAHEAGLAAMQVARSGRVVSDTVVFEYKAGPILAPSSPAAAPLPSLDYRRFSLLQRLQRLHGRLQLKTEPMDDNNQLEDAQLYSNTKFEDRLVAFCQSLSNRSFGKSEGFTTEPGEDCSSILHLAAALGYSKLTTTLLRWRQDDNNIALDKEVNLGARDSDNCTPLMVAGALGHTDTAIVLARWSAGTRVEAGARAAAAAARRAGHMRLASILDRIHPPSGDAVFRRPLSLSQKSRVGSLESNLVKRPSVDSGINMADAFRSSSAIDKSDGNSSARWERSMSLPLDSDNSEDSIGDIKFSRRMDLALCETARRSPAADALPHTAGEQDDRVFTLAEQIIAAMPERIKNESTSLMSICDLDSGTGEDSLLVPLLDDTTTFSSDFNFEFCDNTYRYCGGSTPCSSGSVSPGSALSPPPESPRSALPTSSATLQEFLNTTTHFSSLTLNDREQRELYSAAITIQKAYRQYRGRLLQRRAAAAAITIQNCYRRYKQFAYLKQMHAAATVIQRGYRSLRDRRLTATPAKRTYSQRRQNQAARKIQQFMRQSKIKLQSERAENVKVVRLCPGARRSLPQPTTSTHMPNRIIDYLAPESSMDADDDLLIELLFKM